MKTVVTPTRIQAEDSIGDRSQSTLIVWVIPEATVDVALLREG
jgi:hypothetical protein